MFDVCEHRIRQIIIRAAIELRRAKNLPEEKNITMLYNEVAPLFGIQVKKLSSRDADHLPAPYEMVDKNGKLIVPRKQCPKCDRVESMILTQICSGCKDSEGGKYKTAWVCLNKECGFKEPMEKFYSQALSDMGVEAPTGMKKSLGIKTITDEGLK